MWPLLLPVVGFVGAAVLLRHRRIVALGCLGVAACLLVAVPLASWAVPSFWIAGSGPLVVAVVATLAGAQAWSRADRVAVRTGAAGAAVVAGCTAAGAGTVASVAGGCTVLGVLCALGLGGASEGTGPGRGVRTLWLGLGGGAAALLCAGAWLLLPAGPGVEWTAAVCVLVVPAALVVADRGVRRVDVRRSTATVVVHGVTALGILATHAAAVAGWVLAGGEPPGRAGATVLLLVCAAGYGPLRSVLRPHVESLLFGRRLDPLPVLADLGRELQQGTTTSWLAALTRSCALPWARLHADGVVLAHWGEPRGGPVHRTPLRMDGQVVGELVVGLDPVAEVLPRETELVLALLATPLAHAVRSARSAADLQRARERTAAARDAERRRLGEELHDGLGASLTGLGYAADAAARLLRTRPDDAEAVLAGLRADAHDALTKVRRIVAGMRPAELDGAGLVVALQGFCDRYRAVGLDVELTVSSVTDLPADVEVAVHRVVTEAVTNAARHSGAHRIRVDVQVAAEELLAVVQDDAGPSPHPWEPGNGLTSMRTRADRLGGHVVLGPTGTGGRVELRLPLAVRGVQSAAVVAEIVAEPSTLEPR